MKVVTCLALLFLLGFIQESYQYGTIFTDNITPAFQDSTYFKGIKTEKAFSTDADVGVIQADNLLGFTVSTPGALVTESDTFSITGSHEINFGNDVSSNIRFHSDGDFTTTSQRTGISGGSVDFAGTGDVFVGGLDATLQAGGFSFSSDTDLSVRSTGDVLRVISPVGIDFTLRGDGVLDADRNIQIVSETSDITFLVSDDFNIVANHIDLDGTNLVSIDIDHDIEFRAGSIIEFLPVGNFEAQVDDLDITVSSGDIQLIASSRIHFHGNESLSSYKLVAEDDVFFTIKSASESTMAILCGDDITVRATFQITLASFLDQSDLSLAAIDRVNHTAPVIELTTINGTSIAAGTLSTTASDYVLIEVLGEDLFATAINGPITFSATGNFSLATNNDFVAEAENIYQKTNSDIQIFARNILFRQDNVDSTGGITVNSETDIEVTSGEVLYATSGENIWNIQGDATVLAEESIDIFASKGYVNDLIYSVNGNTTIVAGDNLSYTSSVISISATDYFASALDDYRVNSQNNFRLVTEGTFDGSSQDISFNAPFGDITWRITGDSIITTTGGDITHLAYTFEMEADNIDFNSEDVQVEVESQLSAEVSGNVYWETTIFELESTSTTQILADTLFFNVLDTATVNADQAVQLSQNYPGDFLQVTTGEFNLFGNSNVDIIAGGNLNLISSLFTADGDSSYYYADETLEIRADQYTIESGGDANFISHGSLLWSSGNSLIAQSNGDFHIDGSVGQFGLTSFRASDILLTTSATPGTGDLVLNAEDVTFAASNSFSSLNGGNTLITVPSPRVQDEARSRFYGNTLVISAVNLVSATSDFVNFYANGLNQESYDYLLQASNTLKVTTPLFTTTFDDVTLTAPAVTWTGDALTLVSQQAGTFNADFDLDGNGDFDGYSGVDFLFNIQNQFTVTAPTIVVTSPELLSIVSEADVDLGFTDSLTLESGGKTTWKIAQDISYEAGDLATMQSFYTNINARGAISFTSATDNTLIQAVDGYADFIGNNYMTLTSGTLTRFTAGNSIDAFSQVLYSANSDSGVSLPLTGPIGFSAHTEAADGNIVFDALLGELHASFADSLIYRTNSYTDIVGATGVAWQAVNDITVSVAKDFNISSIANTRFTTRGDFTHQVQLDANYQSRNGYILDADEDFLLSAAKGILVSTGEQGQLDFLSQANLDVVTSGFQHWRASDSFTVTSANNGIVFNSRATDISVRSAGGQISFESPTGGSYSDIAANNMLMFSGDSTRITAGQDQTWAAGTQSRNLAKGDVFFDGLTSGSFQFTSTNRNTWNADGTRFDQDGISFTAPALSQSGAATASYNPVLSLLFGGETRPVLNFATGGSPSQAGYVLRSQGNIYVESETGAYTAGNNYFVNTFKDVSYSSDEVLSLSASTGAATFLSDAGNLKFFAEELSSTAGTTYSITATSGVFEILSASTAVASELAFEADTTITTNANSWNFVSGTTDGTFNSAKYATTTAAKFVSADLSKGSLSFYGNTLNQLTARGAVTIHTLGQDGHLLVQSSDLDVTTKTSSDITFTAAGKYRQGSTGTTTLTAGTSLNFNANSVDGSDYTSGDIRFLAKGAISMSSIDTMTFTAHSDILIQADAGITVSTTGDIETSSFDDTVIYASERFTSSLSGLLTFENSPGSGGDWSVISSQPSDSLSYTTGNDVTWDMGGNIYGYAAEPITFSTLDSNGQNIAQAYTTTAAGGNIVYNADTNAAFRADDDVNINSNGPLSVLGFLNTQFTANGLSGTQSLTFNATNGNIAYVSELGSIRSRSQGQFTLTASGDIMLDAAGISRDSNAGISVSSVQGSSTFGAGKAISVSADEAITFALDHLGARFVIGASRFIEFGDVDNGLPTTSTTLFKATGHEADIVLNLRDSRDGIGALRFLAGAADPLLDYKSANAVVDVFATESIRFEQNSGFTWAGIYPQTFTTVTGSTSLSPSDIFFNADGEHSSIEVSTTKEALLANINILTQGLILEADGKMTIATFGESGSSVQFRSVQEAVKVQSISQTSTDGVFLTSYNGDISMLAVGMGEIHLEPERNLLLTSYRGFDLHTDSINMLEPTSSFLFRVVDGEMNLNFGTLTMTAFNDIEITTFQRTDPTGKNIYFNAPDIHIEAFTDLIIANPNLGNIYFRFGTGVDFTNVGGVFFTHPSSLTIPMREADLAAGEQCSLVGELVIYRNIDFFNAVNIYTTRTDQDNDSGVQLCFCTTDNIWACRILSNAQPYA